MKFFRSKRGASDADRPTGTPGRRLYAIGDVHGCYGEMCQLLDLIEQDHRARAPKDCFIVFLGDLVDRGPHSKDVIRHLLEQPPEFADLHVIKGNHEEMMLRCLSGEPDLILQWLQHGGNTCARSYGIDPSRLVDADVETIEHLLLSHIPRSHIAFLDNCVDSVRFGDYLLVHAGVRPGVPLDRQSGQDLRWIRKEFLDASDPFGATIVHGHTITQSVTETPVRIGIDTGAYKHGVLTAVRLEGTERSFLQAGSSRIAPKD